ncbi:hypothetical protein, partial [Wenzhouxiangella sp. EGI_FJ10409]|uniref:hypothetical protein n=1 Tax=Wenzhouxiangella sp. EGI_FJ10409 TaxID=3243767 RepID=UPI0035D5EFFE
STPQAGASESPEGLAVKRPWTAFSALDVAPLHLRADALPRTLHSELSLGSTLFSWVGRE